MGGKYVRVDDQIPRLSEAQIQRGMAMLDRGPALSRADRATLKLWIGRLEELAEGTDGAALLVQAVNLAGSIMVLMERETATTNRFRVERRARG